MNVARTLFLLAALVGVGMGLVRLRTDTRQSRYLISRMQARQQALKRTCLDLELTLARLRNPGRLETENQRWNLDLCPPDVTDLQRLTHHGAGRAER